MMLSKVEEASLLSEEVLEAKEEEEEEVEDLEEVPSKVS